MVRSHLAAILLSAFALSPSGPSRSEEVAVFAVERTGKAAGASVCPGDLLQRWTAADPSLVPSGTAASGPVLSWHQFDELGREQGYATSLLISGERAGEPVSFLLTPGEWGLTAMPRIPPDLMERVEGALASVAVEGGEAATRTLRDLACQAAGEGDPDLACWILLQAASRLGDVKRYSGAISLLEEAIPLALEVGSPFLQARIAFSKALILRASKDYEGASRAYRSALELREPAAPSLFLASIANSFGAMEDERGRHEEAADLWLLSQRRAVEACPGALAAADAFNNLGNSAHKRRDFEASERFYRDALTIREALSPTSSQTAQTLNNYAIVLRNRGDLPGAEAAYRRSLGILELTSPGSRILATALNNFGTVTLIRGDLAATEEAYRRALLIFEADGTPNQSLAATLQNLGSVCELRRDYESAQTYYEKALKVKEGLPKNNLSLAITLSNLGTVAEDLGDLDRAEALYLRAMGLREALAPGSLDVAESLENLGSVAFRRGDLPGAETYHRRSLEIRERVSPTSVGVALSCFNLSRLAFQRGDMPGALDLLDRSADLYGRLAPGSYHLAEALQERAKVRHVTGDGEGALCDLTASVEALEAQRGRMGGGSEGGERFSERYAPIYRELITAQVRSGLHEEGFRTLERFRARTLLAMLAERDLDFSRDAPPQLLLERRHAAREYDRIQEQLAAQDLDAASAEAVRLEAGAREILLRKKEIDARIREASPQLADLEAPAIMDARRAGELLGGGTLLLSYCVTPDSLLLFALLDGDLAVSEVEVNSGELGLWVRRFRQAMAEPSGAAAPEEAGRKLSRWLLTPAGGLLSRSSSVLICPDGPLHALPFAALPFPGGRSLIEEKPVSTVLSTTVLRELQRGHKEFATGRIAIFADPSRPGSDALRPGLRDLAPIPGTRREAAVLERTFPGRADLHLGPTATEEAVRSLGSGTSVVHFATHAILDTRRPLDSALVLAKSEERETGGDNGLLQVWEVLESVRFRADLVTLSACQTGLGAEMGGEGLIGLTRAFHYAGARHVLSSLWRVSDESTGALMGRFYGHLARGRTPAQALRAAQVEMIHTKGNGASDLSHPFHWAAFVLSGPST